MNMNVERWIYLDSISYLIAMSDDERMRTAVDLLAQWSENAEGSDLARAACYYLAHFVIPTAQGEDLSQKIVPLWIDETLFHPLPDEIESVEAWLSLFPNHLLVALNERIKMAEIKIDAMSPEIIERSKEKNYGLYFTPNQITGAKVSPRGSRHLDENVGVFNAFFLDFDGEDKDRQLEKLRAYPVQPSYAVETKRGYQPYWFIRSPLNEDEWRKGMKRLIEFFDTDRTVSNPSRLMRLPFTWHTKTDDKFLVKVEVWSAKRYDANDVLAHLPKENAQRDIPSRLKYRSEVSALTPQTLVPNQRHAGLMEEVARLYAKQPKEKAKEIRERAVRWYEASCQPLKPHWNQEVNDYCDWVERREFGEVISQSVA